MIKIDYYADNEPTESISGQIEFIILFDKINSLINFYNFTQSSSKKYLKKIESELHEYKKEIKNPENRTFKHKEFGEITFTEEEMCYHYKDKTHQVEYNFVEFQKMSVIVILYSEIEKFFKNIINLHVEVKIKKYHLNPMIIYICKYLEIEYKELLESIDLLRKIRNTFVHKYNYWFEEFKINENQVLSLKEINDSFLTKVINRIFNSLIIFEKNYNNI